jgi:hypothetical protein
MAQSDFANNSVSTPKAQGLKYTLFEMKAADTDME